MHSPHASTALGAVRAEKTKQQTETNSAGHAMQVCVCVCVCTQLGGGCRVWGVACMCVILGALLLICRVGGTEKGELHALGQCQASACVVVGAQRALVNYTLICCVKCLFNGSPCRHVFHTFIHSLRSTCVAQNCQTGCSTICCPTVGGGGHCLVCNNISYN